MSFKGKMIGVSTLLTAMVRNALAANNNTVVYNPSLVRGKENFDSLQYSDKATWIIDLMYYITSLIAVAVVVYCAFRLLTGGWGDLEAEIQGRKGLWTALLAIVLLRIGLELVNVVFGW
jgi:hypothetical protein